MFTQGKVKYSLKQDPLKYNQPNDKSLPIETSKVVTDTYGVYH